jgi:hypothetical protein
VDCFEKFDPIGGNVPLWPFYGLFDVAWKAREILEGMSRQDICWIERDVDSTIEHMREFVAKATAREASYLEQDPTEIDDDLSEVEALRMSVESGLRAGEPGEPSDSPARCAAVLALMFVARCIETLECPEEDLGTADEGPVAARLIPAADDALNAALAVGLALMYENHSWLERELEIELDERVANFSKERASRAAQRKHQKNRDAKERVFEWCDNNMSRFKSMDDAAMDIAETFIPQKFRAVRDWMTEWKKLRSASKP